MASAATPIRFEDISETPWTRNVPTQVPYPRRAVDLPSNPLENRQFSRSAQRANCPFHMNVSWAESSIGSKIVDIFGPARLANTLHWSIPVRAIRAFSLLLVLLVAPTAASAVTLDQVAALHKAGVTDAVILALIGRDRTALSIQPSQI